MAGYRQPLASGGLAYGSGLPEGWAGGGRKVDFFDVKGDLEALLAPRTVRFERAIRRSIRVAQLDS